MTGSWRHDDLVIVHDLRDDEVYEVSTYVEQPDGSLLIGEHLESEATFYRADGERLSPVLNAYGTVDRLIPTGERNLSELRSALEKHATRVGIAWDGDDPMDWLLAVRVVTTQTVGRSGPGGWIGGCTAPALGDYGTAPELAHRQIRAHCWRPNPVWRTRP